MIKLTLKDGSIRELEAPAAAAEVIKGIGMGLYQGFLLCQAGRRGL